MKTCSEPDCTKDATIRGMCKAHYSRHWRAGSIKPSRNLPGSGPAFIAAHVADVDLGECLIWPFHRHKKNGYGSAKRDGRTIGAHVLMCIEAHGPAPFLGAEVAHNCGRGHLGCVHPQHVRWSTRGENFADKLHHGTDNRGERHYATDLTAEQVMAILCDKRPAEKVAQDHGTTAHTVYNIRHGISWAWLTGIKRKAA